MDINIFLKNKNLILNSGIIVLALFIALQIYRADNQQIGSLIQQKEDALKKNEVIQSIGALEEKIDNFKQVFPKKDLSSIMGQLSNIAKNNLVKIVSIKPVNEEAYPDYIQSSFLINIYAPSYHALGNFISQIENNKDIFMVGEMGITPASIDKIDNGLNVNLKISAISFI